MKKTQAKLFKVLAMVLVLSLMIPMMVMAVESEVPEVEDVEKVEEQAKEVADGEVEEPVEEEAEEVEEKAEETEEEVTEEAEEEVTEEAEVVEETEEEVEEVEEVVVKTATSTPSKVLVNGEEVSFEAYLIDGFNYFKLRDLAEVVKGTEKQFEVDWDAENNLIKLISNQEYTSKEVELLEGDGLDKEATLNKSKILIDDVEVELEAYTINGLNYFKLRDVAQAFDIGVTYNEETAEIGLDTTTGYIE